MGAGSGDLGGRGGGRVRRSLELCLGGTTGPSPDSALRNEGFLLVGTGGLPPEGGGRPEVVCRDDVPRCLLLIS